MQAIHTGTQMADNKSTSFLVYSLSFVLFCLETPRLNKQFIIQCKISRKTFMRAYMIGQSHYTVAILSQQHWMVGPLNALCLTWSDKYGVTHLCQTVMLCWIWHHCRP